LGSSEKPRQTFGHSLVVDPWGEILVDMGAAPGVAMVDLNLELVSQARERIPALAHDRDIQGP